jgi:hypothetical protein
MNAYGHFHRPCDRVRAITCAITCSQGVGHQPELEKDQENVG